MKISIIFILTFFSLWAHCESYSCDLTISNLSGEANEIKTNLVFDLTGFNESCKAGPCKKQFLIDGESFGDKENISLIIHNSKPPVIAAMIWNLKLGKTKKFTEFGGLAGTDYGQRLYYQTTNKKQQYFVECQFKK